MIRKDVKVFKDSQEAILTKTGSVETNSNSGSTSAKGSKRNDKAEEVLTNAPVNTYFDLVEILNLETRLCERKLSVLRMRRQEEEDRKNVQLRKLAKLKEMEDKQSRDPANFRNQANRF